MSKIEFKNFAECVLDNTETIAERAIAFLYFRTKFSGGKGTVEEIATDFLTAGLGRPQPSKLRTIFKKDRRTKGISNDVWIIPSDKLEDVEINLNLTYCFNPPKKIKKFPISHKKLTYVMEQFVNQQRIKELKLINSDKYDLCRLLKMCQELNDNFNLGNYISSIILTRAILDHISPIFGFKNFTEVANNFKCEKSVSDSFKHLDNSSRKIADGYLHIQIRKKETLPNATQVNFSQGLDLLLGEVIRIL